VCGFPRGGGGTNQDSSLSLAGHWHGLVEQRHGYSHGEIAFFGGGISRWVLTFIRNISLVQEWERSGLCICHTIMLCVVLWMLLKAVLVHIGSKVEACVNFL
jgi:hypothetical protein